MSLKPYYSQKCPACQRRLSIDVEDLGFEIECWHCSTNFVAVDHDQLSAAINDPMDVWIDFTDHDLPNVSDDQGQATRRPK